MEQEISACRLCGSSQLVEILDLGMQARCGVFPTEKSQVVERAPLKLVKCVDTPNACGLLQLAHTGMTEVDSTLGENGYAESWLDHSRRPSNAVRIGEFVEQLIAVDQKQVHKRVYNFNEESIGSSKLTPSIGRIHSSSDGRRIVVMPMSALSNHPSPLQTLLEVRNELDEQSVCLVEEKYMPCMMQRNAYDSLCHHQKSYYSLRQIRWLANNAGLKIIALGVNLAGAATTHVAFARETSPYPRSRAVERLLDNEARDGLSTLTPYHFFAGRVFDSVAYLRMFLEKARAARKSVSALGAACSGNVILQACGATTDDISEVGEVNADKIGAFTPGSLLPIVHEEQVLQSHPSFLLVLPWRLRDYFISKSRYSNRSLLFPLPAPEVIRVRI